MIIKLTECRKIDGEIKHDFDIWVNMANFVTMNRSIKGKDTHIKLVGAFLFVKETPEEIMEMLTPKAQIDINAKALLARIGVG